MNKTIKTGLLSLIAITQTLTLVGGFIAYRQMSETMSRMQWAYIELLEETHPTLWVTLGLTPNPFAPLIPIVLVGLFVTLVLLIDQIRHKSVVNKDT